MNRHNDRQSTLEPTEITRNVIATYPQETMGLALKLMVDNRIHHLPVLEGERVVGMLSERELFAGLVSSGLMRDFQFAPVERYMRRDVPIVTESTEIREALSEMRGSDITALPVVENGVLTGILTETDLLRMLEGMLSEVPARPERTATANGDLFDKGGMLLADPLVQRVVKTLSDMGL